MKKIILLAASFLVSTLSFATESEKYIINYNPLLPLCQEFKVYLEQYKTEDLACGLLPEGLPKDITFPKWKVAPQGLGERLFTQAESGQSIRLRDRRTGKYEKALDFFNNAKASFEYHITKVDLNHDGKVDNILRISDSRCHEFKTSSNYFFAYDEQLNLNPRFNGMKLPNSGQRYITDLYEKSIFLNKGRAYIISVTSGVDISEPYTTKKLATATYPACNFSQASKVKIKQK